MSKETINLDLSLAPPQHLSQPQSLQESDQLQQLIPQETQQEEEITTLHLHPWAKSTAAEVHTLNYLLSKNINKISGEMMCKSCKKMERLEYNLRDKFAEVCKYIKGNVKQFRHRASEKWMNPELGKCGECRKGTLKPVISEKKEEINWLFLMLGQMIGCCRLDQLKYFCDKNSQHKIAAKDRLVYIAYVVICNQLDPTLAFEL